MPYSDDFFLNNVIANIKPQTDASPHWVGQKLGYARLGRKAS